MIVIEADIENMKVILKVPNKDKPVYVATMNVFEAGEIVRQIEKAVKTCIESLPLPERKVFDRKVPNQW